MRYKLENDQYVLEVKFKNTVNTCTCYIKLNNKTVAGREQKSKRTSGVVSTILAYERAVKKLPKNMQADLMPSVIGNNSRWHHHARKLYKMTNLNSLANSI